MERSLRLEGLSTLYQCKKISRRTTDECLECFIEGHLVDAQRSICKILDHNALKQCPTMGQHCLAQIFVFENSIQTLDSAALLLISDDGRTFQHLAQSSDGGLFV